MTTLKVKSSYEVGEKINDRIAELVGHVTGKMFSTVMESNPNFECVSPVYVVQYTNTQEITDAITLLTDHRNIPLDGFDDVEPRDFVVSIESSNINPASTHLNECNRVHIEEQVNLIDYMVSDIVSTQEDQQSRIDGIYEYLNASGLTNYSQMMNFILTVLMQRGMINQDDVKSQLSAPIH